MVRTTQRIAILQKTLEDHLANLKRQFEESRGLLRIGWLLVKHFPVCKQSAVVFGARVFTCLSNTAQGASMVAANKRDGFRVVRLPKSCGEMSPDN